MRRQLVIVLHDIYFLSVISVIRGRGGVTATSNPVLVLLKYVFHLKDESFQWLLVGNGKCYLVL